MRSTNPATGETLEEYPAHDAEEVKRRLEAAARAQRGPWRAAGLAERAAALSAVGSRLKSRRDALARLMTQEMGKPLSQARSEVDKCAWVCSYYAEHGAAFLADEVRPGDAGRNFVSYRPLGVVLAVMPWNFPLWQVFRCAAPTLMAGNGMVLKHASNVPGCALEIEKIIAGEGIPEGLFSTLLVGSDAIASVIEDPRVAAVSLTGSTPAGRAVASTAGHALKPCVLELGGSDPYVVLEDADPKRAAAVCVAGRMLNNGQSCIAAKRFIVVESIREAFTAAVVDEMKTYALSDPMSPETRLGPMARADLRDELHAQVQESVKGGAKLALGGEVPERAGAWYPATVPTHVPPGTPAHDEELFGPVAAVIPAKDADDALRIANDSDFGLGACVITKDVARGERIAKYELEAGACFVNDHVRSDPRVPFGGIKTSGYGRELAREGIRAFVNVKTVCVYDHD